MPPEQGQPHTNGKNGKAKYLLTIGSLVALLLSGFLWALSQSTTLNTNTADIGSLKTVVAQQTTNLNTSAQEYQNFKGRVEARLENMEKTLERIERKMDERNKK